MSQMLVKSEIDLDSFVEKITKDSPDKYYNMLYVLIDRPNTQNMDKILSLYPINDLVNSLKHLIKFKFNCLTDKVKKNIIECVRIILQYNENVDTLIINCLRVGLLSELNEMFVNNPKYFEVHKMGMFFLGFSTQEPKLLQRLGLLSRDFYFKKVLLHLSTPETFTSLELESLSIPTPISYISAAISVDLELNIVFISTVKNNFEFYKKLILDEFIISDEIAFRVLRFCVYIPFTNNILMLSKAIVKKYPIGSIALIYDLLFYNGKENISALAINWINILKSRKSSNLDDLRDKFVCFDKALSAIYNTKNIEEITKRIYNLNFTKYYETIQDVKDKKMPFIGCDMYKEIIEISQDWDNYMQVYLWKILSFQKILFDYDIPEVDLVSLEAKEGVELIKFLQKNGNR